MVIWYSNGDWPRSNTIFYTTTFCFFSLKIFKKKIWRLAQDLERTLKSITKKIVEICQQYLDVIALNQRNDFCRTQNFGRLESMRKCDETMTLHQVARFYRYSRGSSKTLPNKRKFRNIHICLERLKTRQVLEFFLTFFTIHTFGEIFLICEYFDFKQIELKLIL